MYLTEPVTWSHVLTKESSPGWEKSFDTREEALAELLRHICGDCLAGGETGEIPHQDSISDLLSTPCGCEFWYETQPE